MPSTPSEPLPDNLDPLRDALAAQYEVERVLGTGGMGTVLLARDVTLDRRVAIKVVSPEVALAPAVRERFLREARTVARLRHPNIVAVHAAGEAAGMLYFVMEYVEGESLRDLLQREGSLDSTLALRILSELANALEHAHRVGIVHRDLKPENVLLEGPERTARLTDFGIARAFQTSGDERLTGTGLAVGTPRYMSPEQATGEREIDGRSDIYTLGLLGYEMVTGGPAFTGTGPSLLVKQITERPEAVSTRVPDVPAELADAIERALEKEPSARWQSAGEMAAALSAGRTDAASSGVRAHARRLRRRPRTAVIGAIAALVVVIAAGLALVSTRGDGGTVDPRRSFIVMPFRNLSGNPELDWLREGSVNMLTFSLGQWGDLSIIGFERTLDLLRSSRAVAGSGIGLEQATDVAREAGAGTLVMGRISQESDSIILDAEAYDARTGRSVRQVRVADARGADPRPLFDALATELLDVAGVQQFAARQAIAASTTSSVDAFRHYVEGVRHLTSWRLDEADSAFARAIAIDSTFALAHYKRAIGRGWSVDIGDSMRVEMSRNAARHAGRLPERERALIQANLLFAEQDFRGARQRYAALVARDSGDAEAWYGLADAMYHGLADGGIDANYTASLRAFRKAIELDPTLHLAYAHEVELFTNAARPQMQFVLIGDSVVSFRNREEMARIGDPARIAELRRLAAQRAISAAREWVLSDPNASRPVLMLANAQIVAGEYDDATQTLERAMSNPATATSAMPFRLAVLRMRAGRSDALPTLRQALDRSDADTLRAELGANFAQSLLPGPAIAAYGGSPSTIVSMVSLMSEVFPARRIGGRDVPMRELIEPIIPSLRLGMGDASPETQRLADRAIAKIERADSAESAFFRQQYGSLPYLAYLHFGDERYRETYDRWVSGESPTLGALAALRAGDTTRARQLAASFQGAANVAGPFSGSLRAIGEATVLAEMGELGAAVEILEAIEPTSFEHDGPEGRWAFWPRSFLVRGTLYEQLGRRADAAAAYRRFLDLWQHADPSMREHLEVARTGLARVTDASDR